MDKLTPKEIPQAQMFGVLHPFLRSREWWIIMTSNDALPIIEFKLSKNCPGLVVEEDIKSWEEPYGGSRKFGALLVIIRHDKCTFDQLQKCFGGSLLEGKDVFACPSPEHPEHIDDLMEFARKLSDFMNDSDKKT